MRPPLPRDVPARGEALIALDAALETGLPVWVSLTPGPDGPLLTPREVAEGAAQAAQRGAAAVLVNCLPAARATEWVRALADAAGATPFGVYANAGHAEEGLGWGRPDAPRRYADLAAEWVALGASIIGGCCGTGPAHIAELARRFAG